MYTAISCASCSRPLRIPAELLGQTVRCPFCTDTFIAVADPSIELEEPALHKTGAAEAPIREPGVVALLEAEPEPTVVEESFTVDLEGPVKAEPPKPWSTWVFVRSDTDRRLWGEMQAEISVEGLRLVRGRKELTVPVGCEATWVGGGVVRVLVGSRTVEFQIQKKHVYKRRLAADVAGFLNGERPLPVNKGYRWPWYQWLLLLAPLALIVVLIAGELPETPLKPLKGFGIFLFALLAPVLAYVLWHIERLPVAARWTTALLLAGGAFLFSGMMYWLGPNLPPAAPYAHWSQFAPASGRYSVTMPAPPETDHEFSNGLNFTRSRARVKPNQLFTVAYADLNGNMANDWARMNALTTGQQYVYTLYPKAVMLGSSRAILLGEHTGIEESFSQGSAAHGWASILVHIYLVGQRLYVLSASETSGGNDRKFLDSFKVNEVLRTDLPSPRTWNGLLAYWSFDELDRDFVREEVSSQPSALNGCQWTPGRRRKGVTLPGNGNAHLVYDAALPLNFRDQGAFTYAGWFKTLAADGVLVSQRNGTDRMALLNVAVKNGRLTAEVHQDGNLGLSAVLSSAVNVNDGQWHHFALARDNGSVNLWLDGQWQRINIEVGAQGAITTNLRTFGCDLLDQQQLFAKDFTGSLDEICVFNRQLTQQEINQLAGK